MTHLKLVSARFTLFVTVLALVVTGPPARGGGPSCTYEPSSRTVVMQASNGRDGSSTRIKRDGERIAYKPQPWGHNDYAYCGDATIYNTDRIEFHGGNRHVGALIDLQHGDFAPGATLEENGQSEIEFYAVWDGGLIGHVEIRGSSQKESFFCLGSGVTLNKDADTDFKSVHRLSQVIIAPEAGNDLVDFTACKEGVENWALGGKGGDRILGGRGFNWLSGGPGPDTVRGMNGGTLSGDEGNDLLRGGNANDTMYGGPGDDLILGRGGKDHSLEVGIGNDVVKGGRGRDWIIDGHGHNRLWGQAGADKIEGGNANDHVIGGGGSDEILGRSGDDELEGSSGDDEISGDKGDDHLDGDAGRDKCDPGPGKDTKEDCER